MYSLLNFSLYFRISTVKSFRKPVRFVLAFVLPRKALKTVTLFPTQSLRRLPHPHRRPHARTTMVATVAAWRVWRRVITCYICRRSKSSVCSRDCWNTRNHRWVIVPLLYLYIECHDSLMPVVLCAQGDLIKKNKTHYHYRAISFDSLFKWPNSERTIRVQHLVSTFDRVHKNISECLYDRWEYVDLIVFVYSFYVWSQHFLAVNDIKLKASKPQLRRCCLKHDRSIALRRCWKCCGWK